MLQSIPKWLQDALTDMRAKYPDDNFDVILRKVASSSVPEWRVKCLDCPGKVRSPT